MTTRHYQHPDKPISHPGVTLTTMYGSTTPFLRADGHPGILDAFEQRHGLKRVYPLGHRTF